MNFKKLQIIIIACFTVFLSSCGDSELTGPCEVIGGNCNNGSQTTRTILQTYSNQLSIEFDLFGTTTQTNSTTNLNFAPSGLYTGATGSLASTTDTIETNFTYQYLIRRNDQNIINQMDYVIDFSGAGLNDTNSGSSLLEYNDQGQLIRLSDSRANEGRNLELSYSTNQVTGVLTDKATGNQLSTYTMTLNNNNIPISLQAEYTSQPGVTYLSTAEIDGSGNVTQIENSMDGAVQETVVMTYDSNINPISNQILDDVFTYVWFQQNLDGFDDGNPQLQSVDFDGLLGMEIFVSENNLLSQSSTNTTINAQYQYNTDNYPIAATLSQVAPGLSYSTQYTYY